MFENEMTTDPPRDAPRRTRLSGLGNRRYWRSLEELQEAPEFRNFIAREFPEQAAEWPDGVSRRRFLKLMAASFGLAGLTSCTKPPPEKIVPYVVPPERIVPGKPLHFATTVSVGGYGVGVLAESHMGRPTKIEGNPDHPASLGATDAVTQASVLDLWDPDRAKVVSRAGEISTWGAFLDAWKERSGELANGEGRKLRILTETITSPTLRDGIAKLLEKHPGSRWHHYDPVNTDHASEGARLAFGRRLQSVYRFERARRILSLDSDFLFALPGSIRYARDFMGRRRVRVPLEEGTSEAEDPEMNRLYVLESTPTVTGATADHRVGLPPDGIETVARAVAAKLGVIPESGAPLPEGVSSEWLEALVEDLEEHRGESLVIPGEYASPGVHALAHAMNGALGNTGETVYTTEPVEARPAGGPASLRELVRDMRAGEVDTLLVLSANPVLTAPADLGFLEALNEVPFRIHHSIHYDETSFHCHWHLPESHYLESWGDLRAYDGTVSLVQPLIAPLYQSRSADEVVAAMAGIRDARGVSLVREFWRAQHDGDDFESFWESSLRKGVIEGTELAAVEATVEDGFAERLGEPPGPRREGYEIVFRPDPTIRDGRHANNGWLQELPKPLTKLTWDNAALLSPRTARELGVKGDVVVKLRREGLEVDAPVWVLPGQPDGVVTVYLGYGRDRAGSTGTATDRAGGFNAYRLRTTDAMWSGRGLEVIPTPKRYPLACTQTHQVIEGATHEMIRVESFDHFVKLHSARDEESREAGDSREEGPEGAGGESEEKLHDEGALPHHEVHHRMSIYPEIDYSKGHKWAMEIDNNTCIGCNACVVACQAENNVPIVGKEQVLKAREMHWLRIDTYYEGSPEENPGTYFEPVPCMHCEKAPCEVVCPVAATTHSAEGLNEMTYNRCVGTRYCSNNCPYKVRRFNYLTYTEMQTPSLQLRKNPEVTVRDRGVMEKCTYCVQRINRARIDLKKLELKMAQADSEEERRAFRRDMDREMRDLQPACAQACPTQAITFGDLNWKYLTEDGFEESEVKKLREQPQDFGLLTDLNTEPRTRYLPSFKNPNPRIAKLELEKVVDEGEKKG